MLLKTAELWTIAGFDPSGGAGILADRQVFTASGLHSHALITALTAQNSQMVSVVTAVDNSLFIEQFQALRVQGWPKVIKVGLLPSQAMVRCLSVLLNDFTGTLIYDPVIVASSGKQLMDSDALTALKIDWLPRVDVITPNIYEAEFLTGMCIDTTEAMQRAAYQLCFSGIKQVIIKGGHLAGQFSQDIWCDGIKHIWLTLPRLSVPPLHGSGCIFSAALASGLIVEPTIQDAFVYAKMLTHQALKAQRNIVSLNVCQNDFPWLTSSAVEGRHCFRCLALKRPLGFYTIINEVSWISKLKSYGVNTMQLRLKETQAKLSLDKIRIAVRLSQQLNTQLFINDDWQAAIATGAYGVHLGQEDLEMCDISAVLRAGLRLGISTHSLSELARAKALQPSYIAFGPIFATTTKAMIFKAQGLDKLKQWRNYVPEPLVAIGGITLKNIEATLACQVDSVAVVSAVTKALDPALASQQFLSYFKDA